MANADEKPVRHFSNASRFNVIEATSVVDPGPPEVKRLTMSNILKFSIPRNNTASMMKGSAIGTVIAAAGRAPHVNPTGNARLATAGTGDVLAGMIGARLAQGDDAWQAATQAVFWHGQAADQWPPQLPLIADRLAEISPGRRTASGLP